MKYVQYFPLLIQFFLAEGELELPLSMKGEIPYPLRKLMKDSLFRILLYEIVIVAVSGSRSERRGLVADSGALASLFPYSRAGVSGLVEVERVRVGVHSLY